MVGRLQYEKMPCICYDESKERQIEGHSRLEQSSMKRQKRKLKAIELFAGAGGMALGLQQAGVDVVVAVEKDNFCVSTLKANKHFFPKMKIVQEDITTLTGEQLLKKARRAKGNIDILSGGPPCQGFSTASSRRSISDPRSKLMWEFIRMVKEIQPRYFIVENVRGLLSFMDFFKLLLKSMEKCGYVVRFNLLDCASYGVPQRRLRVIIHGVRNDLNKLPTFPAPTHFEPKQLEQEKDSLSPPIALVAQECFAVNGFDKSDVEDVWWNTRLNILMNKKKAADEIEQAVMGLIYEQLFDIAK